MSTAMEHNSVIPLYAQIVEYLRKDIAANVFGRNGKIPTEAELSEKYGVSRITVRRAVDELVSQGLVEKKQGKPLDYVIMRTDDYIYRKNVRDRFITDILEMDITDKYDPEYIL